MGLSSADPLPALATYIGKGSSASLTNLWLRIFLSLPTLIVCACLHEDVCLIVLAIKQILTDLTSKTFKYSKNIIKLIRHSRNFNYSDIHDGRNFPRNPRKLSAKLYFSAKTHFSQ